MDACFCIECNSSHCGVTATCDFPCSNDHAARPLTAEQEADLIASEKYDQWKDDHLEVR